MIKEEQIKKNIASDEESEFPMPWAVWHAQLREKQYKKWSKEENNAYAQFLVLHQDEF